MLATLGMAFVSLLVSGCFHTKAQKPRISFAPGATGLPVHNGPSGDNAVQIMYAILDMPLGDDYINDDVWDWVNEQQLPFERKQLLEENGFRVGVLGGTLPDRLQGLLASDRCSTPPRRVRMFEDSPRDVVTGTVFDKGKFRVWRKQQFTTIGKNKAKCRLTITPSKQEDGSVRIRFEPEIKHGDPSVQPRPVLEPSGTRRWEMRQQQETEEFRWLRWDLTISPTDFVIIGVDLRQPNSLGRGCFVDESAAPQGKNPVQRLLILRAMPGSTGSADGEVFSKGVPLAVQASLDTSTKPRR